MNKRDVIRFLPVALLMLASTAHAQLPLGCMGNCDDDGQVRVNELSENIHVALGELDTATCAHPVDLCGTPNGVVIYCWPLAVHNALEGCRTSLGARRAAVDSTRPR